MKPFYYILAFLISLVLFSCNKYLDKKPDSKLTVPITVNDLQALLDDEVIMTYQRTPSYGESSADDYYLQDNIFDIITLIDRNTYTWTNKVYSFPNDWANTYHPIYNSNYCLEQVNEIPVTLSNELKWKNIKGSAYFFRAYYFLNLAHVYAKSYNDKTANTDLGIVLRLSSDFNIPSVRASVKATYEQIISDAKTAAGLLQDFPSHKQRPSKIAAYGLLARTYLSMGIYDSAYKYSNLCLVLDNTLIDYNDATKVAVNAPVPFKPFNEEVIFFNTLSTTHTNVLPLAAKIDTTLFKSYDDNDLRKSVFFYSNSGWAFKGSYAADATALFSGIATDEMYLVRSECSARLGHLTEAMDDLNSLLIKRWNKTVPFIPYTATDAQDALNKVLNERRKELVMRGLRWSDIKRYNLAGASITIKRMVHGETFQLEPNDSRYALPLPDDIIKQTGMSQN
jgi:hypothetical protein